MLVVISPAKRLDWDVPPAPGATPRFQRDASILAGHARQLSLGDLKGLMRLSDDLARLNRERFRSMATAPTPENSRPAVLAFAGDTYQGLDAATLGADARDYASRHLRILSGLYGVLRPWDAIQPYRLEMGSRLKTRRGTTLYAYWGDRIARALATDASEAGTDMLVNCASREYFAAVDETALGLRIVTPRFLEGGPCGPRVVGFHAKRARGAMARFVCERRPNDPRDLLAFTSGGYRHLADLSRPDAPAFLREHPASDGAR